MPPANWRVSPEPAVILDRAPSRTGEKASERQTRGLTAANAVGSFSSGRFARELIRSSSRHPTVSAWDHEGAITDFTAAIEAFPRPTSAFRLRVEAKAFAGDKNGAEDELRR